MVKDYSVFEENGSGYVFKTREEFINHINSLIDDAEKSDSLIEMNFQVDYTDRNMEDE